MKKWTELGKVFFSLYDNLNSVVNFILILLITFPLSFSKFKESRFDIVQYYGSQEMQTYCSN